MHFSFHEWLRPNNVALEGSCANKATTALSYRPRLNRVVEIPDLTVVANDPDFGREGKPKNLEAKLQEFRVQSGLGFGGRKGQIRRDRKRETKFTSTMYQRKRGLPFQLHKTAEQKKTCADLFRLAGPKCLFLLVLFSTLQYIIDRDNARHNPKTPLIDLLRVLCRRNAEDRNWFTNISKPDGFWAIINPASGWSYVNPSPSSGWNTGRVLGAHGGRVYPGRTLRT
jgi:hypothetical protein